MVTIMSKEDILSKVKNIVANKLGVSGEEIAESSSFTEDLGADSLDVVELLMAFEDEFQVKIPDEEVNEIKTVGDAVNYISNKQDAA